MFRPTHPTIDDLSQLARQAGALLRMRFDPHGVVAHQKSDSSLVTEVDIAINRFVIQEIQAKFPTVSIEGEEESAVRDSKWRLLVDPIDGTLPFMWGITVSTIILTLLHEDNPEITVIYDPFNDHLYVAQRGRGSQLNGQPIRVNKSSMCGRPVVGISSWPGCSYPILHAAAVIEENGYQIVKLCSIGYMMAAVASGKWAATIYPGNGILETAGGCLLIKEAGGQCTDLFGRPLHFDANVHGHIMSNGLVHSELLGIVSECVNLVQTKAVVHHD